MRIPGLKTLILSAALPAILVFFGYCTYVPVNGSNTIKGKEAKAMLDNAIQEMEILIYLREPEMIIPENPLLNNHVKSMHYKETAIKYIEDTIYIPAIDRLDVRKTYRTNTIENCVQKIYAYGRILAMNSVAYPETAALGQCDIREASLIQNGRYRFL